MPDLSRRGVLCGLIAAPAVIRVAPLMRIVPVPLYGVGPIMSVLDEAPVFRPGGEWIEILDQASSMQFGRNIRRPIFMLTSEEAAKVQKHASAPRLIRHSPLYGPYSVFQLHPETPEPVVEGWRDRMLLLEARLELPSPLS